MTFHEDGDKDSSLLLSLDVVDSLAGPRRRNWPFWKNVQHQRPVYSGNIDSRRRRITPGDVAILGHHRRQLPVDRLRDIRYLSWDDDAHTAPLRVQVTQNLLLRSF